MRLKLTMADGEEINYEMTSDSVSIGRSSKSDLIISHEAMSRHHCKIELKDGDIYITDLGSVNGVYIDGQRIQPHSSVPFQPYLHLAFGYVTSAQLIVDSHTQLGIVVPSDTAPRPTVVSSAPTVNNASGAVRPLKPKPGASKPVKPTGMDPGQKAAIINVSAFLLIVAALYYFMYHGKEPYKTRVNPPKTQKSGPAQPPDHF